jgi:hypothetical protein
VSISRSSRTQGSGDPRNRKPVSSRARGETGAYFLAGSLRFTWSPVGLILLIPVLGFAATLLLPPDLFQTLWGQPYFLTWQGLLYSGSLLGVLLGLSSLMTWRSPRSFEVMVSATLVRKLETAAKFFSAVSIAAYLIWLALGLFRGLSVGLLVSFFAGSDGAIWVLKRTVFAPVSGLTTWVELAVIAVPLLIICGKVTGRWRVGQIGLLVCFTFAKSLLASERLALIELLVASAITLLTLSPAKTAWLGRGWGFVVTFLVLWVGNIAFFAVTEANRSWIYYSRIYPGSLFDFSFYRVLGYYVTALNNGSLFWTANDSQLNLPFVWNWLELIPGVSAFVAPVDTHFYSVLFTDSNPEFNNVSGLLVPGIGLGYFPGAVVLVITVLAVVYAATLASRGNLVALVVYACSATGILELVRHFYLGETRFFAIFVGLGGLILYMSNTRKSSRGPQRQVPETMVASNPV